MKPLPCLASRPPSTAGVEMMALIQRQNLGKMVLIAVCGME